MTAGVPSVLPPVGFPVPEQCLGLARHLTNTSHERTKANFPSDVKKRQVFLESLQPPTPHRRSWEPLSVSVLHHWIWISAHPGPEGRGWGWGWGWGLAGGVGRCSGQILQDKWSWGRLAWELPVLPAAGEAASTSWRVYVSAHARTCMHMRVRARVGVCAHV